MADASGQLLTLDPQELVFYDVQFHQLYGQTVTIHNHSKAAIDVKIKPNADRYNVVPSELRIKPGDSALIDVRLKLVKFAHKQKAIEKGVRDVIQLKTTFFDQRLYSTFFLAADASESSKPSTTGNRSSRGLPASPLKWTRHQLPSDYDRHNNDVAETEESARPSQRLQGPGMQKLRQREQSPSHMGLSLRGAGSKQTFGSGEVQPQVINYEEEEAGSGLDQESGENLTTTRRAPINEPSSRSGVIRRVSFNLANNQVAHIVQSPVRSGTSMTSTAEVKHKGSMGDIMETVQAANLTAQISSPLADGPDDIARESLMRAGQVPFHQGNVSDGCNPDADISAGCSAFLRWEEVLASQCNRAIAREGTTTSHHTQEASSIMEGTRNVNVLPGSDVLSRLASIRKNLATLPLSGPDACSRERRSDGLPCAPGAPAATGATSGVQVMHGPARGAVSISSDATQGPQADSVGREDDSRGDKGTGRCMHEVGGLVLDSYCQPGGPTVLSGSPNVHKPRTTTSPLLPLHPGIEPRPNSALTRGPSQGLSASQTFNSESMLAMSRAQEQSGRTGPGVTLGLEVLRQLPSVGDPSLVPCPRPVPSKDQEGGMLDKDPLQRLGCARGMLGQAVGGPSQDPVCPTGTRFGSFVAAQVAMETLKAQLEADRVELAAKRDMFRSREEALQDTIQRQGDALRDKDNLVVVLQQQLKDQKVQARVPSREDAVPAELLVAPDHDMVPSPPSLTELSDLQQQLAHYQAQVELLKQVKDELQSSHPDIHRIVETSLHHEREVQEERNRKVLELLIKKDQNIRSLEEKLSFANKEGEDRRSELAQLREDLNVAEEKLAEALLGKDELHKRMEESHRKHEEEMSRLQSQLDGVRAEIRDVQAGHAAAQVATKQAVEAEMQLGQLRSQMEDHQSALRDSQEQIKMLEEHVERVEQQNKDLKEQLAKRENEPAPQLADPPVHASPCPPASPSDVAPTAISSPPPCSRPGHLPQDVLGLMARVAQLESANDTLQQMLVSQQGGEEMLLPDIDLYEQLADRDQEVARLQLELTLATGQSELRTEDEPYVLSTLKAELVQKEVMLKRVTDRLAMVEAREAVAQEALMAGGQTSGQLKQQLSLAQRNQENVERDVELARQTAARLNSQVSELMLSEQAAKSEADQLREELSRVHELHQRAMHAMEGRYHDLLEELGRLGGPVWRSAHQGSGSFEENGGSKNNLVDPSVNKDDARVKQALEEGEVQLSMMQSKLLDSEKLRLGAERRVRAVQEECDRIQRQLEHQLRLAQEEGSLRLTSLQETIKKLSSRSELHKELSQVSAECEGLRRSETRLTLELQFAEQRLTSCQQQILDLQEQLASRDILLQEAAIYGKLLKPINAGEPGQGTLAGLQEGGEAGAAAAMSGGHHCASTPVKPSGDSLATLGDGSRQERLIARLAQRADHAEKQVEKLHRDMERLRAKSTAGFLNLDLHSLSPEQKVAFLEGQVSQLQDQIEIMEIEAERGKYQLEEGARQVAAVQAQLAQRERELYDKQEAMARQKLKVSHSMSRELSEVTRRAADAEKLVEDVRDQKRELEQQVRSARLEVARLRADLDKHSNMAQQVKKQAEDKVEHLRALVDKRNRECSSLKHEADERRMQVTVLMETIETLQAGNPCEKDQRVVSMTALLTSARARDAILERRAQELLAGADLHHQEMNQLKRQVEHMRAELGQRDQLIASQHISLDLMQKEMEGLRAEIKGQAKAVTSSSRALDDVQRSLVASEAELEGLRTALEKAQQRYEQQLRRERTMANSGLQEAVARALHRQAQNPLPTVVKQLSDKLDRLVKAVEEAGAKQGAGKETAGKCTSTKTHKAAPVKHTVDKLKSLVLEACQAMYRCESDLRIAKDNISFQTSKVQALEGALERRTQEWEAAEAAKQCLIRAATRKVEQAAAHNVERMALQDRRIDSLTQQYSALTQDLIEAQVAASLASNQYLAEKVKTETLLTKMELLQSEEQGLRAEVQAMTWEMAGFTEGEAGHQPGPLVLQRDAAIREYFNQELMHLLMRRDDVHDKVEMLVREVCGLKVNESQLIAKVAAAQKRADVATLQKASLEQALHTAQSKLEAMQHESGQGPGGDLALQVARLTAELAAGNHQIYQLQDHHLQMSQRCEARELEVQELRAQLAASDMVLQQCRDDAVLATDQLRSDIAVEYQQELQLKEVELEGLRKEVLLAQGELVEAREKLKEVLEKTRQELSSAVAAATSDTVDAQKLLEAEARAARLESSVRTLTRERDLLSQQVAQLEVEVADCQDIKEVTHEAVASLEKTLARIEKSAGNNRVAVPRSTLLRAVSSSRTRTSSGGGPISEEGEGQEETVEVSVALLSRELVKSKMAAADLQRRLRVFARGEVELRNKLASRDQRVADLKEELAVKVREVDQLRRRAQVNRSPRDRSRSPLRGFTPSPPGSRTTTGNQPGLEGRELSCSRSPEESGHSRAMVLSEAEREQLTCTITQLRVEVAKKDGEIDRLKRSLAEEIAAAPQLSPDILTPTIGGQAGSSKGSLPQRPQALGLAVLPGQATTKESGMSQLRKTLTALTEVDRQLSKSRSARMAIEARSTTQELINEESNGMSQEIQIDSASGLVAQSENCSSNPSMSDTTSGSSPLPSSAAHPQAEHGRHAKVKVPSSSLATPEAHPTEAMVKVQAVVQSLLHALQCANMNEPSGTPGPTMASASSADPGLCVDDMLEELALEVQQLVLQRHAQGVRSRDVDKKHPVWELAARCTRLSKERDKLHAKSKALSEQLQVVDHERQALRAQVRDLTGTVKAVTEDSSKHKMDCQRAMDETRAVHEELRHTQEELSCANSAKKDLTDKQADLTQRLEVLECQRASLVQQKEKLMENYSLLQGQVREMEEALSASLGSAEPGGCGALQSSLNEDAHLDKTFGRRPGHDLGQVKGESRECNISPPVCPQGNIVTKPQEGNAVGRPVHLQDSGDSTGSVVSPAPKHSGATMNMHEATGLQGGTASVGLNVSKDNKDAQTAIQGGHAERPHVPQAMLLEDGPAAEKGVLELDFTSSLALCESLRARLECWTHSGKKNDDHPVLEDEDRRRQQGGRGTEGVSVESQVKTHEAHKHMGDEVQEVKVILNVLSEELTRLARTRINFSNLQSKPQKLSEEGLRVIGDNSGSSSGKASSVVVRDIIEPVVMEVTVAGQQAGQMQSLVEEEENGVEFSFHVQGEQSGGEPSIGVQSVQQRRAGLGVSGSGGDLTTPSGPPGASLHNKSSQQGNMPGLPLETDSHSIAVSDVSGGHASMQSVAPDANQGYHLTRAPESVDVESVADSSISDTVERQLGLGPGGAVPEVGEVVNLVRQCHEHKLKAEKWKARCKQLAQQFSYLNSQVQQLKQLEAASGKAQASEAGLMESLAQARSGQQQAEVECIAALTRMQELKKELEEIKKSQQSTTGAYTLLQSRVEDTERLCQQIQCSANRQLDKLADEVERIKGLAEGKKWAGQLELVEIKLMDMSQNISKLYTRLGDAQELLEPRGHLTERGLARQALEDRSLETRQLEAAALESQNLARQLKDRVVLLEQQLRDLRLAAEEEKDELCSRHMQQLQEAQARFRQERAAHQDELAARVAAASGMAETSGWAAASCALEKLEVEKQQYKDEAAVLRKKFEDYQQVKDRQVGLLEEQIREMVENRARASTLPGNPTVPVQGKEVASGLAGGGRPNNGRGPSSRNLRPMRAAAAVRVGQGHAGNKRRRQVHLPKSPKNTQIPTRHPASPGHDKAYVGQTSPRYQFASMRGLDDPGVMGPETRYEWRASSPYRGGHIHQGGLGGPGRSPMKSGPHASPGKMRLPGPPSSPVTNRWQDETCQALQREVRLERLLRHKAETSVDLLRKSIARLKARLKNTTEQLKKAEAVAEAHASATLSHAATKEELDKKRVELEECKEQLRVSKLELGRRQRALQQVLGNAGPAEGAVPVLQATLSQITQALEMEKVLRENLEMKLQQSKGTIDRKNTLIRDLKKRVEELQLAVSASPHAHLEDQLQQSESHIKRLQATISRKDAMVKDLKEKVEKASRSEGGEVSPTAKEEAERQAKMCQRLRSELQKKEAAMKLLSSDLDKEKERLSAAEEALMDMRKECKCLRSTHAGQVDNMRKWVFDLWGATSMLVGLSMRCIQLLRKCWRRCQAVQDKKLEGHEEQRAGEGRQQGTGSSWQLVHHQAIAELVSLSADEVKDLLGGQPGDVGQRGKPGDSDDKDVAELAAIEEELEGLVQRVEKELMSQVGPAASGKSPRSRSGVAGDPGLARDQEHVSVGSTLENVPAKAEEDRPWTCLAPLLVIVRSQVCDFERCLLTT